MADENLEEQQPVAAEVAEPAEPTVAVEVQPEKGRPSIDDDQLGKLTSVTDDEISRANADAKKAVKGLRVAYQEQRRRAEQWSKDAATASNLAEQLYRENQQLRESVNRSESALLEQALVRAKTQLERAKDRSRDALAASDHDQIVASNEEIARSVAEVDRLTLLKPAAQAEAAEPQAQPMPQQVPQGNASARTRQWVEAHPWFNRDQEMTAFAMRQHHHLLLDGITEDSNPDLYWRTIEERMRQAYPEKFEPGVQRPAESRNRPVAVTGGTRSNGSPSHTAEGKRIVRLNESQVKLAKRLGLTNEQYAAQLIKEEQEEQARRPA
jgi:hypothetical protein